MKNKKLFESINILRKNRPHLFYTLDLCEIVISNCPTAQVSFNKENKSFKIEIGQYFYDSLDSLNLAAVIEHELLHVLFNHLTDNYFKDFKIANIAMDSIINDNIELFIRDSQNDILKQGIYLKNINAFFKTNFCSKSNTSREIYDFLKSQNKEKLDDFLQKNQGGHDSHDSFKSDDISELDKQVLKEKFKGIIEKNLDSFKDAGRDSGEIERIITECLKVDYNFLSIFETLLNKTLKVNKRESYKRFSRRLGESFKGKITEKKPKVLLVVDTSGSISDEILKKVYSQVNSITKKYNLTVISGDTRLCTNEEIKRGGKPKLDFIGGGGTDLNFYHDVISKQNFDLIIFDTDGYIPKIKDTDKIPKIFCIFDNGQKVDGYKNITIK